MACPLFGDLQNPPAEAGRCFSPPPFRFGQAATPTAPCQGQKHPLTGLVYVAFRLQRNGSGGSSFTIVRCLLHDFLFFYPWAFLIVAMGTSNCHLTSASNSCTRTIRDSTSSCTVAGVCAHSSSVMFPCCGFVFWH